MYLAGFIVVACLCALAEWLTNQNNKRDKHYKELAKNYNFYYENIEAIKKRFKANPKLLKEAEELYSLQQDRDKTYKELTRKRGIVERVFAYDYEDLLFQIYAPYASENFSKVWSLYNVYLAKGYILNKISEIKAIPEEEAVKIFNIIEEHDLIIGFDCGFMLTPMLAIKDVDYSPSWNIVSDTDMNLDKWMVDHGYKHNQER